MRKSYHTMQWRLWIQTRVDDKEKETKQILTHTKKRQSKKRNKKNQELSRGHSWLLDSELALLYTTTNDVTRILEGHVEASIEVPMGR